VALVLDRSGSMSGPKLTLAKQAATQAVNLLRENDRCALVTYDDEVIKAVRCKPVDATQRASLSRALANLEARNSTNLFGGWLAGAEEISEAEDGRVRRVLILTDGLANVGITQPAEILRHVRELSLRGVGTSAFGGPDRGR
jgi:Ca-activated chloride channel family protein